MKENPYIKSEGERLQITAAGYEYLEKVVTDPKGRVYVFHDKSSPVMTAAAMARLSRRGSDLREIYLDEFALTGDEDASGLIHRVVTAFGDDSVQQLTGNHLVVEDASNLLTKKLEWGRFGAYLEQSTRYIFYDQKDVNGSFKYFIPEELDKNTKRDYIKAHDEIFTLYSEMVRSLTDYVRRRHPEPEAKRDKIAWRGATKAQACDAVRPVLPVSTKSTVGIFGSSQAIEALIMRLLSDELLEARQTGEEILYQIRKVMPAFFERADKPDRGGATTAYLAATRQNIRQLAKEMQLKQTPRKSTDVKLIDYWPRDEFDIIPEILFSETESSLADLKKATSKLSTIQKKHILNEYFGQRLNRRHRPGRALELPHYEWEVTADYGTFRDLQRHRVIDALEWQYLTDRYGFDIPKLVEEAGMVPKFKKCFEISERLVSKMRNADYGLESQYATLFGHRLRYRLILNARACFHFIELRSSPQGHPGYRLIVNKMYQQLSKVHPNIAQGMIFVNKDEDPKLTRLAAELATQYKLEKLEQSSPKPKPQS